MSLFSTHADRRRIAAGVLGEVLIRDSGLLASAVARPRASAFGSDAYPTFDARAAALLHSLARNHALIDGNTRLAWSATRVFCLINGRDLAYTVDDADERERATRSGAAKRWTHESGPFGERSQDQTVAVATWCSGPADLDRQGAAHSSSVIRLGR